MAFEKHIRGGLSAMVLFLSGCAAFSSDGNQLSRRDVRKAQAEAAAQGPTMMPVNPLLDHYEWVKRLNVAEPAAQIPVTAATSGATVTMPIPLPGTVLEQYRLIVDQHRRLAWLQGAETNGPWKLDHPDVAHLLHSVSMTHQQQMAQQQAFAQHAYAQHAYAQQQAFPQSVAGAAPTEATGAVPSAISDDVESHSPGPPVEADNSATASWGDTSIGRPEFGDE